MDKDEQIVSSTGLNCPDRVCGFDGVQALEVLHRLYTIDYGSRQAGSSAPDATDRYCPVFFLDFLGIVGLPLKAITRVNCRLFNHDIITFKDGRQPYPAKHHLRSLST